MELSHTAAEAMWNELAALCDGLAQTTGKLAKRSAISAYLLPLSVPDASRAALWLSGSPFAETERHSLNVGGAILSKAVAQLTGATQDALRQSYLAQGDLGAAAEQLLATSHTQPSPGLTLSQVEDALYELAAARNPTRKLARVLALLQQESARGIKYLLKLMLGDMRTGVKQSLVEEAIAEAYGAPAAQVRRATMLEGDLRRVVDLASSGSLHSASMRLFHPIGLMLASPVETVEEAVERFRQEVANETASSQDPPHLTDNNPLLQAMLEDKYDGVRCQLHAGDPAQPARVGLFSRSKDDMTASFPEIAEAFAAVPTPVILDGEVLAWDAQRNRALPFSALQQRIGRKRVPDSLRNSTPVVFMAFDLLYLGKDLLLDLPLVERRRRLEQFTLQFAPAHSAHLGTQAVLFTPVQAAAPAPLLMLAPSTHLHSTQQLEQAYADARARGNEGVMLKALGSLYQPGRRGLAWLKLKRELATLDVVVTATEFGHGRRAGTLSDYTFAVRDGDQLRNIGKAYSGLIDSEVAELSAYFMEHTLEDFGHVRSVEPLLVLEVAFNNIMRSNRHASGFALRFPRILRIRKDKPVEEIDTLERVQQIYDQQPDKPVED